ncbi:hypothetical protein KR018_004670 [Drosophila ironensis]|nr:hypothetical protein KR018_004670 [Drosophila ironensis]
MGSCSCTRRHFLLSICFLQVVTIIERQVFDFLGYMWAPILVNFFHILFIIFGFYGAYHFRVKYIITYLIWNFLWIGWNAFLICFYLNVGQLDRVSIEHRGANQAIGRSNQPSPPLGVVQDSDLLNLGTGSVSWFEANGYGCKPTYNMTADDPFRPPRPERVEDCLLDYPLVEIIHSGVQCALALLGILGAILISCIFLDEDDRFDFMNGDAKSPQHTVVHPMYVSYTSIPTTSATATMQSNKHLQHLQHQQQQQQNSLKFYHHQQQQPTPHNNYHHNNHTSSNHSKNNYQLSGGRSSNNNTLDNNNRQPPSPDTTTNNHNASHPHAHSHNHSHAHNHTHTHNHLMVNGGGSHSNNSSLRRHRLPHGHGKSKPPAAQSPMSPQTTPSLSYASLQNSNPYLAGSSLSNSNYSLFQSPLQESHHSVSVSGSVSGSGSHFARIHHKPKPPKSGISGLQVAGPGSEVLPVRPSFERLSRNLEEDEDNFSLQQFAPGDHGVTYVPFQSPTPHSLFGGSGGENNNQPSARQAFHSPNNNNGYPYDQNGLPSPLRVVHRPTKIPMPTVPLHSCLEVEDTEVDGDADAKGDGDTERILPPPAMAKRQHILHQRLGQAPYPDLSPEVAERYAMPTQAALPHVPPGSPMVRRSNRRPRPPVPANFCDQIRAPPPGYVVRAQSDDRLVEQTAVQADAAAEAAPHVNRRSGQKTRPRSFCNSIVGVQA